MARKKPARPASKKAPRKAAKKAAPKAAARKTVKKAAKKAATVVRKTAKKAATRAKAQVKKAKAAVKKVQKRVQTKVAKPKAAAKKAVKKAAVTAKAVKAGVAAALSPARKPNLDRPRKTVADIHGVPSSLGQASLSSAARTGLSEMRQQRKEHTSSSPALTAGDVDADWQSADSSGDEAPGGDNPTPDQDVVDEIGRALGVEYGDEEELQGGDEITDRDRHRWELDPASKDDFDEE